MPVMFIFILCSMYSLSGHAQDERLWRDMIAHTVPTPVPKKIFKNSIFSPSYRYDLNADGKSEMLTWAHRDGSDYLQLESPGLAKREFPLETQGQNSRIYKIGLYKLSEHYNVALVYFYQGVIQGYNKEGDVRLYFMTWDDQNLKNVYWQKGPLTWQDRQENLDRYWKRSMLVETVDLNEDGVKEIEISFEKLSRVYYYKGEGQWRGVGDVYFANRR